MTHIAEIPIYMLVPFVLMLGAIAVLPIFAHHLWEKNRNKLIIALVLAIPTAGWLVFSGLIHHLEHTIFYDYIPFIILLGALFVITGGIFVEGSIDPKPLQNTLILGIGAVLASLMGTTGAAMLLIRPIISINSSRKYKVHTILFFIGIVANCGGLLTPLGDPPLFMMYLRGVPFFWFISLIVEWSLTNLVLLAVYYLVDTYFWRKESPELRNKRLEKKPIKIHGKLNFLWLLGVVLAVAFVNPNTMSFIQQGHPSSFIREILILLMAVLSILMTKKVVRLENHFSWEPIEEVAFLFIGIFVTMVPCLLYLQGNASHLGIESPVMFYYATGGLSGFLDNTPTAVTFYYLALGLVESNSMQFASSTLVAGIPVEIMESICVASVFFGSMTYIGNGPNFMVKAIAESQGIKMPDFFGYMWKFSLIVLLPIFILVHIFFIG